VFFMLLEAPPSPLSSRPERSASTDGERFLSGSRFL
jgi:hypothetical protein